VTIGAILGLSLDTFGGDIEEIEEVDIEEMTDGNVVDAMMEEFRQFSPGGANALIDERDAYIASNLHELREQGYDVLAVVGAGHKAGIERHLLNPEGIPSTESLSGTASSRRFSPVKIVGYLIMVAFFRLLLPVAHGGVRNMFLLKVFVAWFLFNGIFAFTLARLAGARWTSAGVGGAVAWLTSINPLLAPGWFAGYVELKSRPVNVRDIQTLNEIIDDTERPVDEAMSAMFDVPLFRLIMIVALTNIGSMIATALFPFVVLPWLRTRNRWRRRADGAVARGRRKQSRTASGAAVMSYRTERDPDPKLAAFSDTELRDLAVAWLTLSAAFALLFEPIHRGGNVALFVEMVVLSFITVGMGFLLHEVAHKVVAIEFGQTAEFRADYQMLFLAIMGALVGFLFAAPGPSTIAVRSPNGRTD